MRSRRLPPYLQDPIWRQFAEAIDEVWKPEIDDQIARFRDLDRVEHIHPNNEHKVGTKMLSIRDMFEDSADILSQPWLDKRLRVKQATDLGFTFSESNNVGQQFYEMLLTHGPQFWGEAGTKYVAAFLGFVLNARIEVFPLWTSDYVEFVYEEDVAEADMLTNGGTYYPTAHVDIVVNGNISATINVQQLVELFYMVAPIHLVIRTAEISFSQTIADFKIAMAGRIIIHESDPTPRPDLLVAAAGRFMIYDPTSTIVL